MKLVDPSIELVACGSSGRAMPTFGAWEAQVLEQCYDAVDHISLHAYYDPEETDVDSFLASSVDMLAFIGSVVATCDHARAKARSDKQLGLSFDEWNVWYLSGFHDEPDRPWAEHPRLIEDTYTLADAVVVGTLLITLLRNADRVKIACLAQLVNAIASRSRRRPRARAAASSSASSSTRRGSRRSDTAACPLSRRRRSGTTATGRSRSSP